MLPRWIGPYKIVKKVNPVAYQLGLPEALKIHAVLHASLPCPYQADGRFHPPPPILIDGEEEFEVDRIVDHRDRPLAEWSSETVPCEVVWLWARTQHLGPEQNLQNCKQSLGMYWNSRADKQGVHEKVSWGRSKQQSGLLTALAQCVEACC